MFEKSKVDAIKLVEAGKAYLVEIREPFPGDVYVFVNEGTKWLVFRNGKAQGEVEKRNVINGILNCNNESMIFVSYHSITEWVNSFIEWSNSALNVIRRPCFLRFSLTDGPVVVAEYDMPVRKTNVFQLVVSARERKFDQIEYEGRSYHLVGWDRLRIKGKYYFRLTLDCNWKGAN